MDDRPISLLSWAYDQIKQMLFSGELKQGEKLVVSRLAKQLSISPTPVKEALNRLVAEGLLNSLPRRGFQVKQFSCQEIHDIFDCRLMMETYAAEPAIKNWDKHPEIQQNMYQALADLAVIPPHDYVGITHLERIFHSSIIALSGNCRLGDLYDILYSAGFAGFVYIASYHPEKAQREHQAILQALNTQDLELLTSTLKSHLTQTVELYENFTRTAD